MEYKIGDEVIWDKTPYIFDGYFANDTERVWLRNIYTGASSVVLKSEIIPASPCESRKELKKRIKELEQYKHHVGILRSRLELSEKQKTELKEKLANAQEAIEIVEMLEKLSCGCRLIRSVSSGHWRIFEDIHGSPKTQMYTTIKDALQAAGLMESGKDK